MRVVAAVALLALAPAVLAAPSLSDSSLTVTPFLSASNPTGIRFTGPNQGFVIEQGGAVKRFVGATTSTVLNLQVATDGGERGLLGIAVDPAFATNGFVYLYHSAGTPTGGWIDNRLTRHTWNGTSLAETPFATPRTFGSASDGQAQGPNHNGGPLVFGRDGKLYGVTGDLNRSGIEQNVSTTNSALTGGVYRLNTDATIPTDNPFQANANAGVRPWYAYGVRNSFGIAVDPHPTLGGNLWITENGPNVYDEINLVPAGTNSGWSQIMGPDARDTQNAPGDLVMLPGASYQDPKFSIQNPVGIAALGFLHGSSLGAGYDNAVIYGSANQPTLQLLRLNASRDGFVLAGDLADGVLDPGDTPGTSLTQFGNDFGIVTDIQIGPDGALYVTSIGNNAVYRIAPVPEPHAWALLLAGIGLVGWTVRARGRPRRCASPGSREPGANVI
jgi:aldose sugar dehydrogenase